MRYATYLLLLVALPLSAQTRRPSERQVASFHAEDVSRLAALARLGAITDTTMLVQAGSVAFMQGLVNITADHVAASSIIDRILAGPESYLVRDQGNLLIISPAHATNRVLAMSLGPISFRGTSLSSLYPFLNELVRIASGCQPQGYAGSGSPMDAGIPPFDLTNPIIEQVLEKVADAPRASMWIFAPEPTQYGCIEHPAAHWQALLYGCEVPFQESVGLSFLPYGKIPHAALDGCSHLDQPERMPNPVPFLKQPAARYSRSFP